MTDDHHERIKQTVDTAFTDHNPQTAIFIARDGTDAISSIMNAPGTNPAQNAISLLGLQLRYFADAFDVSPADIAHDATRAAMENESADISEEVTL